MEAYFKDGNLDGPYYDWHSNGFQANVGRYKDGKEDGLWVVWSENGKTKSKKYYKNGREQQININYTNQVAQILIRTHIFKLDKYFT